MYKITRVEEVSRNTLKPLSFNINKYKKMNFYYT